MDLERRRALNNLASRRYRKRNPEKRRAIRAASYKRRRLRERWVSRRWRYGITEAQYNFLWRLQNKRCAICRRVFKRKSEAGVDHDHKTGKIRGLLCVRCNPGLGNFKDCPELLRRAAAYLENNL